MHGSDTPALEPVALPSYLAYFLRLGAFGFGGPIVLTSHMRKDLVDDRHWVSHEEFENGLALAQLAPGPLAAQLAIFLGWVRFGVVGATLVAGAFIIPSFIAVLALAMLYVNFSGLPWIQGAFYGIGAAVIAIMALGVRKLVVKTIGKDPLLWLIGSVSLVMTAVTEKEAVWVFLGAGVLNLLVRTPPKLPLQPSAKGFFPPWIVTGLSGAADRDKLWQVFGFFAKAGAFVFGSGLAIVPFLHGGVVNEFGWLNERQFIDAVAVAMITPGPVVITVAFIGYLVAGGLGACAAAIGVFLPCYLFVIIPAPYFQKYAKVPRIKAFIAGVTAAAVGAIAGAAIVLGRRAIIDVPTAVICAVSIVALLKIKRLPEPLLIAGAGLVGLALKNALF